MHGIYVKKQNMSLKWEQYIQMTVGTLLVAQVVEALRYKPEGRGFDSRWFQWMFSLTQSFRPHYGSGVDSASNRNEYQECFLGVGLTTLPPPSCADCLEI
jgi:hypothetical protein